MANLVSRLVRSPLGLMIDFKDFKVIGLSIDSMSFQVPLSNVSNAVANKNEAVLEFHQNDDCPVALIEMRFHIPTNEDDTTDPVEAFI